MNKTKKKIIEHALVIFNEHGFYNSTLRQIALSVGVSQGNLNYHFKTKSELLEILYFDLVDQMEVEMGKMSDPSSELQLIFESSKISLNGLYNYRFFMNDLYKIMREHENIRVHYSHLQSVRLEQFTQVFNNLINQKLLRKEDFENEYNRLYKRMNILGDNWINAQGILNNEIKHPVEYYHILLFEVIYPYLTSKGKIEYNNLINR